MMDENKKACIAYIIGVSENSLSTTVYDYGTGTFSSYSNTGRGDNFQIYDFKRSCYVMGHLSGLYDFGTSSYININKSNNSFSGYDFGTNSYFSGTISGNVVTIYDSQSSMNVYTVQ